MTFEGAVVLGFHLRRLVAESSKLGKNPREFASVLTGQSPKEFAYVLLVVDVALPRPCRRHCPVLARLCKAVAQTCCRHSPALLAHCINHAAFGVFSFVCRQRGAM